MPDNLKNKNTDKNYQQKAKQNQQKANRYQQEAAEELTKANQNLRQATTKAQQKPNQYQQEMAQDFLNTKRTNKNRSGYIIPDMDEEAGMEFNTDKIKKTGQKDSKKKG
ncbi:MAG: hypothetical protein ACOX2N_01475 [Peptococcia bacterium]|jgi:hypothetical protein